MLQVLAGAAGTTVRVRLHATRVATDDPEVQAGIDETLQSIRQLAGERPAS